MISKDPRFYRFTPFLLCGIVLSLLLITACPPKPQPPQPVMTRLNPDDYPHFADQDGYRELSRSIEMSLSYLRKLPANRQVSFGKDVYLVAHLIDSLQTFAGIIGEQPSAERLNKFLQERYFVYQAAGTDADHNVLFTGYYEPMLKGSLTRTSEFSVPVYGRPSDLLEIDLSPFADDLKKRRIIAKYQGQTVVPYPDRKQIRRIDGFERLAPALAWLQDEIDLFNLMVQGSGKVQLPDGKFVQVQFEVSNGQPYRSIGRLLIDQGKISRDKMSMQAIREYLQRHPREVDDILNHNPRYIFFRRARYGPVGALAVPLTPGRSIAIDRSLFPSAALAFVTLPLPQVDTQGNIGSWQPAARFVLAQDTGSAIKGPGRVDLFWGHGQTAEVSAGHLKHQGRLYFLVLRPEEGKS